MIGVCVSIPGAVKSVKSGRLGTLPTAIVVLPFPHTCNIVSNVKVVTSPAAVRVATVVVPGEIIPSSYKASATSPAVAELTTALNVTS